MFFANPFAWLGVLLLWRAVNCCGLAMFGRPGTVKITLSELVHKNGKDQCRIRYLYNDADGGHIDFDSFPASYYDRYPPGSTIPMRSFRMFGHTSIEFDPYLSVGATVGLAIFAFLYDGIGILGFHEVCLATLAQRRLLREGDAVMGRITYKTIPKKKSPIYGLAYVFTDAAGKDWNGSMQVPRDEHERAQINDEVLVFYNPRGPRRSVLYAYSQYALREWRERDKQQALLDRQPQVERES